MSDINDLIHSNARVAFVQGKQNQRQRSVMGCEKTKVLNKHKKIFIIRAKKIEEKVF